MQPPLPSPPLPSTVKYDLGKTVLALQAKISSLENENSQIEILSSRLKELEAERSTYTSLEVKVSQLEYENEQMNVLKERIRVLEVEQVEKENKMILELTKQIEDLEVSKNQTIEQHRIEVNSLRLEAVDLLKQMDLLRAQLKFVDEQRMIFKSESDVAGQRIQTLLDLQSEIEEKLSNAIGELSETKLELANTNQKLLLESMKEHNKQIGPTKGTIMKYKAEIDDLLLQREADKVEIETLKKDILELKKLSEKSIEEICQQKLILDHKNDRITDLEIKLSEVENILLKTKEELSANIGFVAELRGKLSASEESYAALQESLGKTQPNARISLLVSRVSALESRKSKLVAEADELRSDIVSMQTKLNSLATENQQLKDEVREREKSMSALYLKIAGLEQTDARRLIQMSSDAARIDMLKKNLVSTTEELKKMETECAEKSNIISIQQGTVSTLQAAIDNPDKDTAYARNMVKLLENKIAKLRSFFVHHTEAFPTSLTNSDIEVLLSGSRWDASSQTFKNVEESLEGSMSGSMKSGDAAITNDEAIRRIVDTQAKVGAIISSLRKSIAEKKNRFR